MEAHYKERISQLSDEELVEMVEQNAAEFSPEALRYVREELEARNIPFPSPSTQMWTCPQCGERLEAQFNSCWKCSGGVSLKGVSIKHHMITNQFMLEGYRTVKTIGIVRGLTVRSRGALGNLVAGIQQFFGGNITAYTSLCEQARQDAFDLMKEHAEEMGANAIVGMRYDATEIAPGVTEVLAYGTGLVVEQIKP